MVVAAITLDGVSVISPAPSIDRGTGGNDDGNCQTQTQSVEPSVAHGFTSTPPSISSAESEDSVKTLRVSQSRPSTPTNERQQAISSGSIRPFPRSILVSTDPIVRVRVHPPFPAASTESRKSSTEYSESSPSSSESELQTPATDDSSRTTLASSSSSCIDAESTTSSTRTRAATLCSTNASLCVTFAPLPEIGPRQRKSSRPIGLAARGQMLRQRRMMMAQGGVSYYYDDGTDPTIPGGEKAARRVRVKDESNKEQGDDLEDTEIAIAAIGKMLGDATKTLWQRVASSKPKGDDASRSDTKLTQKRPKPSRGLTWPGRQRRASTRKDDHGSDDDSESDLDGPWSRRRDEDPMTKTIREGSDDELDEFVLAYDTMPGCEEEQEEQAIARADEEMRTTVEVHLVKASEGD